MYLWRAVDHEGEVLDMLVQRRRDTRAALRLMRKRIGEEEVTNEQIAAVVSRSTGVPVEKMLEGERTKLLRMEDQLRRRVVGQEEALEAVSEAVRAARRAARPEPADWQLPLPRPGRRRQD
jgi:ATP-dependent Clp protease ATP-binding subunit ClpA